MLRSPDIGRGTDRVVDALQRGAAVGAVMLALLAARPAALAAEAEEKRWSASVTLVSDYRSRGISESWSEPALQGLAGYEHPSGWYAELEGSQVSSVLYPGANVELDFVAGYGHEFANGMGINTGIVRYTYPGSEGHDGALGYFGISRRALTVRYTRWILGGVRGSEYLEVNADFELGGNWQFGLHAGTRTFRGEPEAGYSDWRASLAKALGQTTVGISYTNTDADRELYSVQAGSRVRQTAGPAWVAWISRSF
jgi:uncharacterized protein (TIGR02001 family)